MLHGALSFDRSSYSSNVLENMPLNSVILTVITNRQSDKRVQYYIEEGDLPGHEFSIGSSGDLTLRKTLDYETRESFSFRVVATDGRQNDTTRVNITVININDWDPRWVRWETAVTRPGSVSPSMSSSWTRGMLRGSTRLGGGFLMQ